MYKHLVKHDRTLGVGTSVETTPQRAPFGSVQAGGE